MIDLGNVESYRENNRIEAKKALGGLPHSIWETYSAFANTLGGVILLGVEEHKDKTFHVLDLPYPEKLVAEFKEKLSDARIVNRNILTDNDIIIEAFEGKHFIAINVPRAHRFDKPIFIGGSAKGGTYRRGGEGDYRCTTEEIEAMKRDAAKYSSDMTVPCGFSIEDLNVDTVKKFRDRFNKIAPNNLLANASDKEFLTYIGALSVKENKDYSPTFAGILMFGNGKSIKRIYPDFAPIFELKNETSCEACTYQSENLYEYNVFVKSMIKDRIFRLDCIYPEKAAICEAVDEALVNTLVHADYESGLNIKITLDSYSLKFINPGSLRVSPDMILNGGSVDRRNALLAKMFYFVDPGSRLGGIKGIYEIWRKKKWCPPILKEELSPDRVTLVLTFGRAMDDAETSSAFDRIRRDAAIDHITEHIEVEAEDIAALFGVDTALAEEMLKSLTDDGIIIKEKQQNKIIYKLKS